MTINFEALCKKRTTAWNKFHNELTINYNVSGLKFLGVSYGNENIKFDTHFQISDIINMAGFEEPLWWKISNSKEIENILIDLTKCIRSSSREDGEEEFLRIHKPNNKYPIKIITFDYEGFIFYRNYNGKFDYNKIKTLEYYKCHIYKIENTEYLINLNAGDIFPITKCIRKFFLNSKTKLKDVCSDALKLLQEPIETNILYSNLPIKAKNTFEKQKLSSQMAILMLLVIGKMKFIK